MRKNLGLSAFAITACAAWCVAFAGSALGEREVIKIAERESHQSCHSGAHHDYFKVGCDYIAKFMDGNWNVLVRADYRNAKGERLEIVGAETLYIYSPRGTLLRVLPGM